VRAHDAVDRDLMDREGMPRRWKLE
jgi:hypothetical protein